jgi:hypothetical protein
MPRVTVTAAGTDVYTVEVDESGSRTRHEVTVTAADLARYAPGATPERLLEVSFAFLLEREPKESILSRFELPVIERYFPEYPTTIAGLIRRT